jgi:5-methylcytosine-specific restriction endonuclease McrA
MYSESLIELRNRCDVHFAEQFSQKLLVTRPPIQRENCWSETSKQDLLDSVLRLKMTLNPIHIIQRLDETSKCSHGEDHVFDGAHRIETVCAFIDGDIRLKNPRLPEIDGKLFKEMPRAWQEKIKTFRFCINYIDSSIADDPEEQKILWKRLNSAGTKLNNYELGLPVTALLIEQVIKPHFTLYEENKIFFGKKSKRGALEAKMLLLLALSETPVSSSMSSKPAIVNKFTMQLGDDSAKRQENIDKNKDKWDRSLKHGLKMIHALQENDAFHEDGKLLLLTAHHNTEVPFVLARLMYHFPRIEDFRSKKAEIAESLRVNLFAKDVGQLNLQMETVNRNGTYLKSLFMYIDSLLDKFLVEPRLFTQSQKKRKLEMQEGRCAICDQPIYEHQTYEGDHVQPWSKGGKTTMENLNVVHRDCHQTKSSR